jgi:hypothetical protein
MAERQIAHPDGVRTPESASADSARADLWRRAAVARDTVIPFETGLKLIDGDPELLATFLAPRSWRERAALLNSGVVQDLEVLARLLDALDIKAGAPSREFVRDAVGAMREDLAAILGRLEEIAPLAPTAATMALYLVSGDERHTHLARAWFEGDDVAERRAIGPAVGLLLLPNLAGPHDDDGETLERLTAAAARPSGGPS